MSIFADMNLNELTIRVEEAISAIGVQPEECRGDESGQWMLMRDDMPIYLDAWEDQESNPWNYFTFNTDRTAFQISVPFCHAPTLKRDEFMEEMLVVNLNLLYGKFAYNAKDNVMALVYRIPGSALQTDTLQQVVDGLCYYAEMTYHVLKDEFNLKRVLISENPEN